MNKKFILFFTIFFGVFMWFFDVIAQPLAWGEEIILENLIYRLLFWFSGGFIMAISLFYINKRFGSDKKPNHQN